MSPASRPFLPDRVAGGLTFLRYAALAGLTLLNHQRLWESFKSLHFEFDSFHPLSSLTVVTAVLRLGPQAWIALGVAKSRRWAFGLLILEAAYGLVGFLTGVHTINWTRTSVSAPSAEIASTQLWLDRTFAFALLVYGVSRLFRLFGPPLFPADNDAPFATDRLAGGMIAAGYAALCVWSLGNLTGWNGRRVLLSQWVREPWSAWLGPSASEILAGAIGVAISAGVFRSRRWALVAAALSALPTVLSVFQTAQRVLPIVAFRVAILAYCGARLFGLLGTRPSRPGLLHV